MATYPAKLKLITGPGAQILDNVLLTAGDNLNGLTSPLGQNAPLFTIGDKRITIEA
jgi:hypothetical protein